MAENVKFFQLTLSLIIGALIFLTALAWNNLARKTAQKYYKRDDDLTGFFIYAVIMTVVLVAVGWFAVQMYPSLAIRLGA